jgi:glycosyltransferase involved in cell wall biosynthesis
MKVLYHHRTQGEEPESVHIANIVQALRDLGNEVLVVGPAPVSRHGVRSTRLGRIKQRLPRWAVELAQLVYNPRSLWQLARALGRGRFSFIYERYALYNLAGLLAARLFNLPLILEVNTLYAQAWGRYYGLAFPRLARAAERYVLRRADQIITVTSVQRKLLEAQGVRSERIAVCHNAIDPTEFAPERFEKDELRAQLGLKSLVIGFVGTMNRWQGVAGFAPVVEEVVRVRGDVSFLFVGEGEGRAALTAELERRGCLRGVVFAGRVPHTAVPRYLAAIDVGVLLDSNAYGSPMKVFEYWAMGKAVIAPSVAPVLEILRDGETGLLITPGDSMAMAAQILRLAGDPQLRQRLGDSARREVLAMHTWARNAEEIVRSYQACPAASAGVGA